MFCCLGRSSSGKSRPDLQLSNGPTTPPPSNLNSNNTNAAFSNQTNTNTGANGNFNTNSSSIQQLPSSLPSSSPSPSSPPNNTSSNTNSNISSGSLVPNPKWSEVPPLPPGLGKYLLDPFNKDEWVSGKKTLVLDLDETLVHSSFKPIPNADFVISIELENVIHRVYVRKRPGVDHFLRYVGEKWEVVIFTASLAKYADPLLDILDRHRVVKARLFREACVQHYGNYVKDMTHLGRRIEHAIIIDNSPFSYMFQPENAIAITSWFNDKNDRQLYELLPYLDHLLTVDDCIDAMAKRKMVFTTGLGVNSMPMQMPQQQQQGQQGGLSSLVTQVQQQE